MTQKNPYEKRLFYLLIAFFFGHGCTYGASSCASSLGRRHTPVKIAIGFLVLYASKGSAKGIFGNDALYDDNENYSIEVQQTPIFGLKEVAPDDFGLPYELRKPEPISAFAWAEKVGMNTTSFCMVHTYDGGYVLAGGAVLDDKKASATLILAKIYQSKKQWKSYLKYDYNHLTQLIQTSNQGLAVTTAFYDTKIHGKALIVIGLTPLGKIKWKQPLSAFDLIQDLSFVPTRGSSYTLAIWVQDIHESYIEIINFSARGKITQGEKIVLPSTRYKGFDMTLDVSRETENICIIHLTKTDENGTLIAEESIEYKFPTRATKSDSHRKDLYWRSLWFLYLAMANIFGNLLRVLHLQYLQEKYAKVKQLLLQGKTDEAIQVAQGPCCPRLLSLPPPVFLYLQEEAKKKRRTREEALNQSSS